MIFRLNLNKLLVSNEVQPLPLSKIHQTIYVRERSFTVLKKKWSF